MRFWQKAGSTLHDVEAFLTQLDEWFIRRETQFMTILSKTLLAVSVMGFTAGGIIDFGGFSVIPAVTVALPLGAVFFGLFIISLMMEKEMAKFDEEEAGRMRLAGGNGSAP